MSGVQLQWLGQAGFIISDGTTTVAVDPFLSDYPGRLRLPPVTPAELAGCDAILVSHEHADHLDLPTLAAARQAGMTAPIFVPRPLRDEVVASGIAEPVIATQPGQTHSIGNNARVHTVAALHGRDVSDAYTYGTEISHGDVRYVGYILEIGEHRIYHSGDSLDYPELAAILHQRAVTVALVPINGRDALRESLNLVGNMNVGEVVDLLKRAHIPAVVPMHYDMFPNNLGPVGEFVALASSQLPRMNILVPGLGGTILLPPHTDPRK